MLHNDFPMGRELFSYALEFSIWSFEPATYRLSSAFDIVSHEVIPEIDNEIDKLSSSADKGPCDFLKELKCELSKWQKESETVLNEYLKSDSANPEEHRSTERKAGLKLEELCTSLKKTDLCFWEFRRFLSNRSEANVNEFINRAIVSITGKNNLSRKIRSVTLSRIATYGLYPTNYNEGNHASIANVLLEKDVLMPDNNSVIWPTIGRYDAISIGEARPICRCPLPFFFIDNGGDETYRTQNEKFPPFFTRQETALIGFSGPDFISMEYYCKNYRPIAFSAIILHKRQYRLDFLERLIKAKENYISGQSDNLANNALQESDICFLTDGWGDIVIMFSRKNEEPNSKENEEPNIRLEEIFDFQTNLFQHFMVTRTELILTPDAFNWALKENFRLICDGKSVMWNLAMQVRLIEDKATNTSREKFEKHFHEQKDKAENEKILSFFYLNLMFTAGRSDFTIEINIKEDVPGDSSIPKNAFQNILNFIDSVYLDRVDTVVSKYIPNYHYC